MKAVVLFVTVMMVLGASGQCKSMSSDEVTPMVFVSYAGNEVQLKRALNLARSIRTFAGQYKSAPIWIYTSVAEAKQGSEIRQRFDSLGVEIRKVEIPEKTSWYFLSGMVFTAAAAESAAQGKAAILVFMGSDTIVLQEPSEFQLDEGVSLGYRPVLHKNISPLFSEPLDTYWSGAYDLMNIDEATLFPMVTPADADSIRPYFNAGCMAVRPEKNLFGKWAEMYTRLCADSTLRAEAESDTFKRVFTFQVALIGTFLNNLKPAEMVQLSRRYNYPIFFKEMFGAKRDFHDITDVTTLRHEHFFDNPPPDWDSQLKGPTDRIAWIKEHFDRD